MSTSHPPRNPKASLSRMRNENGKPSGWDRYADLLLRNHVAEKARPWYIRHAKAFLDTMPVEKLSQLTLDDIENLSDKKMSIKVKYFFFEDKLWDTRVT
jgi:hypothetical protein